MSKILILSSVLTATCTYANEVNSIVTLGIAGASLQQPYKGLNNEMRIVPLVMYSGTKFNATPTELSYKAYKNEKINISLYVSPGLEYLDPLKSNDSAIKSLDKRSMSVLGGGKAEASGYLGTLTLGIGKDLMGISNGLQANIYYTYLLSVNEKIDVAVNAGYTYTDSHWNTYYYGVSTGESNSYSETRLKGSFAENVSLVVSYNLNDKSNITLNYGHKIFGNELDNSPLLRKQEQHFMLLGYSQKFYL